VRDVASVPHPALNVTRSAPDGQEVRNRTKGGRGRSVPLTAELVPIIAEWSAGKKPDDLLFTSEEGYRLNNSHWRRIVGWPTNCRGRRIHDLRHTAATFWLQNGVDVKTVQQWLGHESAQLTMNLYAHWMGSSADAAAIARINATLSQGYAGGTRQLS
jgi:integrase